MHSLSIPDSIGEIGPFELPLFELSIPLQASGEFLHWAVVFFIIAIIAAFLGARGVAGVTMTVAKWFVIIFLVLALISILL